MRQFDQNVKASGIQFKEATRKTPDMGQGMAIAPLSFVGGVLFIIAAALICWGIDIPARASLAVGGFAMAVLFVVLFVVFIRKKQYQHKEKITGWAPPYEAAPPPPQIQEFTYQRTAQTQWRSALPAPEPVLRAWIDTALGGGSLSYASWQKRFNSRAGANDGAEHYRAFRQALVTSGWALERGTHSLVLTARGEEALEEWQHQHPDPTPLLEQ